MLPLGHMGVTVAIVRIAEKSRLLQKVDFRAVLLGSMLPDLIDKPIGYLFFAYPIVNGRTYGHSLLLVLLFLVVGAIGWYLRKKGTLAAIGIGSLLHELEDSMWDYQATWLWPVRGYEFSGPIHENWPGYVTVANYSVSKLALLEGIGAGILLYFCFMLLFKWNISRFMLTGELVNGETYKPKHCRLE